MLKILQGNGAGAFPLSLPFPFPRSNTMTIGNEAMDVLELGRAETRDAMHTVGGKLYY